MKRVRQRLAVELLRRALVAAVEAHAREVDAAVDGARGGAGLVGFFGAC